jgi:CRP-like cAMP-binding protein
MGLTSLFRSPQFYVPFQAGQIVFKGEVIGEMALISDKPRVGTVTALTDYKLAPINKKRFLLLVQQSPQFSLHMLETMAERIRWMDSLIAPNTPAQ